VVAIPLGYSLSEEFDYLAALIAYFDDSGTHLQSPSAIVAGWIAPSQQWKKFNRQWEDLKAAEGFEVFHMTDVMSSARGFVGWNESKTGRVLTKARAIIDSRAMKGFAVCVAKKDYDDLATKEFREKFGKHHYTFAVRSVIGLIERWREQENIRERTEYVFDRMAKGTGAKGEIDKVFGRCREVRRSPPPFWNLQGMSRISR